MTQRLTIVIAVIVLTGACGIASDQPDDSALAVAPGENLDPAAVMAISAEFAIQKGMTESCEGSEPDYLTAFMDELRDMHAPAGLMENVERVSTAMYVMARDEEPEYVCTPEMFETAAARVATAQQDWDAIKESVE